MRMKFFCISFLKKIILISIFFFNACTSSGSQKFPELTKKEKEQLSLFFKHLLLRENGIYVLFGSKPLISCQAIYMTAKEQAKEYEKLDKRARDGLTWVKIAFNFQWWENVKDRLKPTQYLIFQKNSNHPKIKDVFFVNISNTVLVLQKNYDLFKKVVGYDFSPLKIVFEIENESSDFWNKVFDDPVLSAVVYGYGLDNGYLFTFLWEAEKSASEKTQNYGYSLSKIFNSTNNDLDIELILSDSRENKLNYQKFPLPGYRSLKNDPQKKKYCKERKKIMGIYQGKDSLEVTLKKLCE